MQVIYPMPLSLNPPFHILLRCWGQDSAHSTSQTPGPAGFLLGSSKGRHSRRWEGRGRGEGPEFRFPPFLPAHSSSGGSWLQPPQTPPRYPSSGWYPFFQGLSTLNPCSKFLGFSAPPKLFLLLLASRSYYLWVTSVHPNNHVANSLNWIPSIWNTLCDVWFPNGVQANTDAI